MNDPSQVHIYCIFWRNVKFQILSVDEAFCWRQGWMLGLKGLLFCHTQILDQFQALSWMWNIPVKLVLHRQDRACGTVSQNFPPLISLYCYGRKWFDTECHQFEWRWLCVCVCVALKKTFKIWFARSVHERTKERKPFHTCHFQMCTMPSHAMPIFSVNLGITTITTQP